MDAVHIPKQRAAQEPKLSPPVSHGKPNQVSTVILYGIPIVSLVIECQERLCLAQISNTLLKQFSYNEIHNRRVALGITCVQCTPVQLEILRRAGAMPVSSRRCGMITRREAERLCKSFLGDNSPPRLPEDFAFSVHHECGWGCRGAFLPSRYNSSRAKCIKCSLCGLFFSPNKFIFHSHRTGDKYVQPDAANFNSWRRHMKLSGNPPEEIIHAWEDVKAMFNGGTRKRLLSSSSSASPTTSRPSKQVKVSSPTPSTTYTSPPQTPIIPSPRVPPFPELPLPISRSLVMDYVWHNHQVNKFPFAPFPGSFPWLKRNSGPLLFPSPDASLLGFHHQGIDKSQMYQSAFRPVAQPLSIARDTSEQVIASKVDVSDDEVDIETTDEKDGVAIIGGELSSPGAESPLPRWSPKQETISRPPLEDAPSPNSLDLVSVERHISEPASPKLDVGSTATAGMPVDRLWSIPRMALQDSQRQERERSLPVSGQIPHNHQQPLLYRHDVLARHFQVIRDVPPIVRNSPPLLMKPLDCTACQGHHNGGYTPVENNNKSSS